jgi:hypothetical protein
MDPQTIIIIALVAFILGMILGASLVRPRSAYQRPARWDD